MTCLGNVGHFTGNRLTTHTSSLLASATAPFRPCHLRPTNRDTTATSAALSLSSLWDMELLRAFNKKYLGHSEYDHMAASLSKSFYNNYLSLSAIGNDIRTNDTPSARPPSLRDLLRSSFGKPSASHSFI
jgi:hypothetical protein